MRRFSPLISLLTATLLLMAVAFADGRPSVFYDSHSYDVMGRNLIQVVQEFPNSLRFKMKPGVKWADPPVTTDNLVDPATEGARSPYYGVLLHGTHVIGTIWLLAAIQSFLAAWVLYLLWRTLAPKAPVWSYVAVAAGVTVGSSLPFFTSFAMPDVFAGIGGGALVLLLTQTDRLKRREIAGLWLLLTYSAAIHKSHFLTAILVSVVAAALLRLMGEDRGRIAKRIALVAGALAAAWVMGAVFEGGYKARTGLNLGHPPFLMARVLADGPGRDYLQAACARDPKAYVACRYAANVTPNSTENLLLWSNRSNLGLFNLARAVGEGPQLEREETRFVLGTLAYEPLQEFSAAMTNWGRQLIFFQVDDPLRNPYVYLLGRYWPTTSLPKLIPDFAACHTPLGCRPPFSHDNLAWWHGAVLLASLALIVWRICLRDVRAAFSRKAFKRGGEPTRVLATTALLLAVIVVNAAVCGILSGPFSRYQSRLIWIAPMAAGLVACALPVSLASASALAGRLFAWANGLWNRMRLQPVIGRFLPPLDGHLMRFGLVGGLGFVVDAGVLQVMILFGMNPIAGRAVSFPVAVFATWITNRTFTFPDRIEQSKMREASTYVAVQLVGGAANFAVYSALVHGFKLFSDWPILALAFGAAAGLVINYLGSKHIVFGRSPAAP